jgi:hypothetical protein
MWEPAYRMQVHHSNLKNVRMFTNPGRGISMSGSEHSRADQAGALVLFCHAYGVMVRSHNNNNIPNYTFLFHGLGVHLVDGFGPGFPMFAHIHADKYYLGRRKICCQATETI